MPLILNGSTGISGTDGSAGTPAVQGTDTNTGRFFPAADQIAFAEGGVEAMRLDAAGNVGIGVTTPTGFGSPNLHINGTGPLVHFTNSSVGTAAGNGAQIGIAGSVDAQFVNLQAGALILGTSGAERARITSGGGFLLNTSDEFGRLTVRWDNSVQQGLTLYAATGTFNGSPVVFYNSSGGVSGFIGQTASSVSYSTGSDYRLKENVVPLTDAAARVQALKPSRFNFIADPDRTVDGFLAHEAAEVVPEAVHGDKDAVNEDGSIKPQGIDHSKLVPLLTAALQEALTEIASLKARVAALEATP